MPESIDINRNHSRPLDMHRWSDHPKANKLADTVWAHYFTEHFASTGRGKRPTTPRKEQFKVLLLDLYVAWIEDPDMAIGLGMSIVLNKKEYRNEKKRVASVEYEGDDFEAIPDMRAVILDEAFMHGK